MTVENWNNQEMEAFMKFKAILPATDLKICKKILPKFLSLNVLFQWQIPSCLHTTSQQLQLMWKCLFPRTERFPRTDYYFRSTSCPGSVIWLTPMLSDTPFYLCLPFPIWKRGDCITLVLSLVVTLDCTGLVKCSGWPVFKTSVWLTEIVPVTG